MIDVEQVPAELLALIGTRMAIGSSSENALAANFQQTQLRNPADSGFIITLLEVRVWSATAQTIALGPTQATFANASLRTLTDTRFFAQTPAGQVLDGVSLVLSPIFGRLRVDGTVESIFKPQKAVAVINPGSSFAVTCGVVNTNLVTNWNWQERVAQPSELRL